MHTTSGLYTVYNLKFIIFGVNVFSVLSWVFTCILWGMCARCDVDINLAEIKRQCSRLKRKSNKTILTSKEFLNKHTLNLSGRERKSLTLMDRPIRVAILQCGMVGVNSTDTVLSGSFTCSEIRIWRMNGKVTY